MTHWRQRFGLIDLDEVSVQDDRLRDVAYDAAIVERAIGQARVALGDAWRGGDRELQQQLLGYLGNACRLVGRTDDAIVYLSRSLSLARSAEDTRRTVVALIRLGEAYRCQDEYATARALFRVALEHTQAESSLAALEDFALQHLGKCLQDQGDGRGAIACLERALTLRQAKANPQLIAFTERALARARERGAS